MFDILDYFYFMDIITSLSKKEKDTALKSKLETIKTLYTEIAAHYVIEGVCNIFEKALGVDKKHGKNNNR